MAIGIQLPFLALFALGAMIFCTESCTKVIEKPCCRTIGWWTGKRCVKWCAKHVWECPNECRHVAGKRSDVLLANNTGEFPCKFDAYDLDSNGRITNEEFFKSQKLDPKQKENQDVFNSADINGDNLLSCEELSDARFRFKCPVVCPSGENQDEVQDQITELINSWILFLTYN